MQKQQNRYDFNSYFTDQQFESFRIPKGQYLFCDGERDDYVYYLAEGEIMIIKNDWVLWLAKEKELVGMSSYFSGKNKYRFSAMASRDCVVYGVPIEFVTSLLSRNPGFCKAVVSLLSGRIEVTNRRMLNLRSKTSRIRLIKELVFLAGENESRAIDLTLEELSKVVGVSRRILSELMNELAQKGMIEYNKARVRVLDLKGLEILSLS